MNAERTLSTPNATGLRWWPASRLPYSIAYDPGVIEAIRMGASQPSPRTPNDRVRTCGLLWGASDGNKVEILACSPITPSPPVKSQDPSPAPSLVPTLRRALLAAQGKTELVPLGFYRVERGNEIIFSQLEARALAELFPEPWQFVMVLYSGNEGSMKIRLFFRLSDGSIGTDSAAYESSPDRNEAPMEAGGPLDPKDNLRRTGVSSGLMKFRRQARPRQTPGRSPWRPRLVGALAGIAVVSAGIEFRIWNSGNGRPIPPDPGRGIDRNTGSADKTGFPLRAEIRQLMPDAVIRVHWDSLAKAVRTSPVGILSVSDGGLSREYLFKRSELDLGYTDYRAGSGEVTFRLMVEEAGLPKQESVLVMLGGRDTEGMASEFPLHPPGEILSSDKGLRPQTLPDTQPQEQTYQTELSNQVDSAAAGIDNPASSSEGTAQSGQKNRVAQGSSGQQSILSPAPLLGISQQVSPPSLSSAAQLGIQRIPFAPPPPAPPDASQKKLDFVPPSVVERAAAVLPYSVRRLAADDLRIKVRVEVDVNGRVTACHPLSPLSGVNQYLADVAREMIMQWRFSPGRLGGKPVASSTVLDLDFAKEP